MSVLPIEPEILAKRSEIPSLIAKLSYKNESKAVEFVRMWGEKRSPITEIYEELKEAVK